MKQGYLKLIGLTLNGLLLIVLSGCLALDQILPTIVSNTPPDGATDVSVNTVLTVVFSEPINASTLNNTSFFVTDGGGTVAGTITLTDLTATFTPTAVLAQNTTFTATISETVRDLAGNNLGSAFSWNFTTINPIPTVEFSVDAQIVDEGVGTVTVTAMLSQISSQTVTVPFIVSGTAISPTDHNLVDGTITISPGVLSNSTTFTVVDDGDDETNETVILTIGTPTNATVGGMNKQTVTINDNDLPTVNWTTNGQTANESVACPCTVTVNAVLSSTSTVDVTVPYTVTGTATETTDFTTPAANPLTITAGNLAGSITFDILDDAQTESSEFVNLTIGVPTNATAGSTVQHSVEIIDDE